MEVWRPSICTPSKFELLWPMWLLAFIVPRMPDKGEVEAGQLAGLVGCLPMLEVAWLIGYLTEIYFSLVSKDFDWVLLCRSTEGQKSAWRPIWNGAWARWLRLLACPEIGKRRLPAWVYPLKWPLGIIQLVSLEYQFYGVSGWAKMSNFYLYLALLAPIWGDEAQALLVLQPVLLERGTTTISGFILKRNSNSCVGRRRYSAGWATKIRKVGLCEL